MARSQSPGVYVREQPFRGGPIEAVGTQTAALIGVAPDHRAHVGEPIKCHSMTDFKENFGDYVARPTVLSRAADGFFRNGGFDCYVLNLGDPQAPLDGDPSKPGLWALENHDSIAVIASPGYTGLSHYQRMIEHCEKMQDRVCILDAPPHKELRNLDQLTIIATQAGSGKDATPKPKSQGDSGSDDAKLNVNVTNQEGSRPPNSAYGAFYFPHIWVGEVLVPPSGHIAGVYSRVDGKRGVHKAPANEVITGATNVEYPVTHFQQGKLNDMGVNCIRKFDGRGIRIWGARTLAPREDVENRYINVRRLVNMIKESIEEAIVWTVFEVNSETLWKLVIRDVSAFLEDLWRKNMLFGATQAEAFYVKCDRENNPPRSRALGNLQVEIGIAPVKPAEFVTVTIGPYSGESGSPGAAES
jgi:phage tail sheath protein FI